jgi:hypothetical protein
MKAAVLSRVFHRGIEGIPALFVFAQIAKVGVVVGVCREPPLQLREPVMQRQPLIDDHLITGLALAETRGLAQAGDGRVEGGDEGVDWLGWVSAH